MPHSPSQRAEYYPKLPTTTTKKAVFTFSGFLARIGASHQLNIQAAGENSRLPSKKGEIISYLLGALGPDLNKILITNLFKVKYPYSV